MVEGTDAEKKAFGHVQVSTGVADPVKEAESQVYVKPEEKKGFFDGSDFEFVGSQVVYKKDGEPLVGVFLRPILTKLAKRTDNKLDDAVVEEVLRGLEAVK